MNNKLFLISATLFFTPSAAQAMDQLPPEVIEHGIIPQMGWKSLEAYGSTNQKNAAAIKKHREDEALPKDAVMACPPVSEVLQALTADTPKKIKEAITIVTISTQEAITIGTQKWEVSFRKEKTPDNLNMSMPESLKQAKLMRITLDQRKDFPVTPQRISCLYKNPQIPNPQEFILITRPLLKSEWRVLFKTCQPINPAYAQKVQLTDRGSYPPFSDLFMMESLSGEPLPEDFRVICAQEEKEVSTSTP